MKNLTNETSAPGGYAYPAVLADEKVGTSMQRSAGDQIQQEMEASETASETQQDAAYARVDQYTLTVIQQIFPAPNKGLEFTANILRYAQVVQNMLPGLEDMGQHVAVISVRTIRLLAKLIDWGYDTTHKYVTTFCALGLLRKVKQGADRLLVFPLERYVLPLNLQPLDSLIAKSRPKVQQFARQVKVRLGQLNPAALPQSESKEVGTFEGNKVYSGHTLYQSLFGIIESEGIDPATSWRLSKRIITEVLSKLQAPALTLETSDQSYKQAVTGTFDGKGATSSTPQLEISSRSQARPDGYRVESSRYQPESTERQQKSTNSQIEYPQTHAGSTDHRHESTGYQTKYPHNSAESTPASVQGRLSGAKVSAQGRLTDVEASSTHREEETQADQSGPAKVSSQSPEGDGQGDRKKVGQPQVPVYTIEEMYNHIMTTWDLLTSYEYILRENLIDWEADGLPTQFIEQLYEEIYTINTEYKKRGMIVASRNFFLSMLEKRAIEKLAYEYQLDFVDVYNLILFRTNRERFMIADFPVQRQPVPAVEELQAPAHHHNSSPSQQDQATYSRNDYQPEYQKVQSTHPSPISEYQYPVEPGQYQSPVDSSASEYQYPAHSYANNQYPVDQYADEYQYPVDSQTSQYQPQVDQYANEYQPPVDPEQGESSHQQSPVDFQRRQQSRPVDPSAQEQASAEELNAQESTPQVPIAELIDQAALQDGLSRLRIPRALSKQNYTSGFLNVYVTYNIYNLFKKIYSDVTLRNDGKMFFAEIFDTARASAAKNWYNRLFTKCTSPENLLAAFVETVIDLHSRGNVTIQNPGGLFNKKVAECEKVIGDNTLENARVYGELCYEDFVLQIARLASRESLGID